MSTTHGVAPATCEQCGRPRPQRVDRFTITIEDHTSGTAAFDKWYLCRECWKSEQDRLRRGVTA